MTPITVACLDMAGTTVADDGTVLEAFEDHYAAAVRAGPGLRHARRRGHDNAAAGGWRAGLPGHRFLPRHQDAIIDRLAWGGLIDLALSPADAGFPGSGGRGRPWPDLPLAALLRLGGGAVSELAVAGDTASDVESGRRAGAAIVAGVLTGAGTRADLEQAGAPLILDTIADILPHIHSAIA